MFKAIEVESEQEIILLDTRWTEESELSALRTLSAANKLVCQECRRPVGIRAGKINRKHFAHKRRADCTYGSESPILLQARAVLYSRLKSRFGEGVTLEKRLEDSELTRPVDCWVEHKGKVFAYWILDVQIGRYEKREVLKKTFRRLDIPVTWIFISTMLDEDAQKPERIHLSPTEREFQQAAYLDITLHGANIQNGETLHYLNPETEKLTTYRSLTLIHPPQVYQGRRYNDLLFEVEIAPRTGEFAHPSERERYKTLQEQKEAIDEKQRQAEAQRLKAIEAFQKRAQEEQAQRGGIVSPRNVPNTQGGQIRQRIERIGVCKVCGNETTEDNWVVWDANADRTCLCRDCARKRN